MKEVVWISVFLCLDICFYDLCPHIYLFFFQAGVHLDLFINPSLSMPALTMVARFCETNDFRIRNNVVTSCSQFDKLDDVGVLPPVGARKDLPRDLPKTHPDQWRRDKGEDYQWPWSYTKRNWKRSWEMFKTKTAWWKYCFQELKEFMEKYQPHPVDVLQARDETWYWETLWSLMYVFS